MLVIHRKEKKNNPTIWDLLNRKNNLSSRYAHWNATKITEQFIGVKCYAVSIKFIVSVIGKKPTTGNYGCMLYNNSSFHSILH